MTTNFTDTVSAWLKVKGYSVTGDKLRPTKFNGPYEFSLTEQTDDHLTFIDPHGGELTLTIGQHGLEKSPCLIILHRHFANDMFHFDLTAN